MKPLAPTTTIMNTAAVDAPAVMPMMSGLASGLRASDWKIAPERPNAAPTSTRGQRARQSQLVDDEVGRLAAVAEDRGHHVGQRDREVADRDRDAEDDERDDGEHERDRDRPSPTRGARPSHDQPLLVERQFVDVGRR